MSIVNIDPNSPLPLYAQVESILAAGIADGTFPPGSQLPNEDELVERYAVSRTTIRQTIQNLIRRGLIEIRRGKGTFVLQPKITQELTELSGFVEDMQSLGRQASARLLDKQVVPASESVARQLAVPAGTLVVRIQRRHSGTAAVPATRRGRCLLRRRQDAGAGLFHLLRDLGDQRASLQRLSRGRRHLDPGLARGGRTAQARGDPRFPGAGPDAAPGLRRRPPRQPGL